MPNRALFSALFLMVAALAIFDRPARADGSEQSSSCPMKIASFTLGGKSLSGREAMYRLDTTVTGAATSAKILFRGPHGATTISWPKIDTVDTPAAKTATFWFTHPASDALTAASVSSVVVDGAPQTCAGGEIGIANAAGRLTVYDDSQAHLDLVDPQSANRALVEIADSSFTKKQQPDYPNKAVDQNIQGEVTVGIDVGTDGKLEYAWIVSRVTSNMSTALDQPALEAALHSQYAPALENGVAVEKRYRIIYNFRIDGMPGVSTPTDEHELCPLLLSGLRIKNEDTHDGNAWYSLDVDAKDSLPVSAVIGTVDITGHAAGVSWPTVPLRPPTGDDKLWQASATFNWSGAPIKSAWIDQVTMSGGKSYSCVPVVDVPDRLLEAPSYPRVMIGAPLPLIPLQTLLPAAFTRPVWPAYPSGRDGVRASGRSTVEVIVDDGGRAREAFVTESSGHPELDLAAVDAASKSSYVPAPPNAVALYEATYRFVP